MVAGIAAATLVTMGCSRAAPSKPDDPDVVAAREAAHRVINQELAALPAAIDDVSEFGRVEVDTCREGQNNWKIKEPFVTECQLQLAVAYSFAGDFESRAHTLHYLLGDRGWDAAGPTTGVPDGVGRWDGEQQSIWRTPTAHYVRGDTDIRSKTVERLWITFGSDTSPDDWPEYHGFEFGRPESVEAASARYGVYYSSVTGIAWGEAWLRAGKPGPLIVVLKFDYIYSRK
jgi:hypothetical protein